MSEEVNVRVVETAAEDANKDNARVLAEQAFNAFMSVYPKYVKYVNSLSSSDLKKLMIYGFRNPFMREPVSFNSSLATDVYNLSKVIRAAQDLMFLVGVQAGVADPVEAASLGEAMTAEIETAKKEEETKND
jgi:hypothetical protein